ncbi:MAG: metallophosphoesterase family protein [Myxococcota bacterium]
MLRILHFSDPHVEAPGAWVPPGEWLGKRALAYVAHRLVRRRRFRYVDDRLRALSRFAQDEGIDLALCTGDLTALGTEPELVRARRALAPFERLPRGLVTFPGNHDIYLPRAVRDGRFERHFGDLLRSDRPDLATDGVYPLVRLPADGVAVVALCSARPNPAPWRSSGRIPPAQLEGLRRILQDPDIRDRWVAVATHHAPRLASGRPDRPWHGLVNAAALGRALRGLRRGMLVHGHVHERFHLSADPFGVPVFGAGSATDAGREGCWLYEVSGGGLEAWPCGFTGDRFARVGPAVRLSW